MAKQSTAPPAQKQMPPFCINCLHFIPAADTGYPGEPARCGGAQMLDLVTGQKFFPPCEQIRHPQAPCGMEGRLFLEKPAPSPLALDPQ